MPASVRRWLRAPALIVVTCLGVAVAALVPTFVPQASEGGPAEAWAAAHPAAAAVVQALGLDRVLTSPWLLVPLALALLSLVVVLRDQVRRALRRWRQAATTPRAWSLRGAAVASPLLHLGLVCLVLAGMARALVGRDAMVDLVEGETLPPEPGAYGANWGGPWSTPFALPVPLTLKRLSPSWYGSGDLAGLEASLVIDPTGAARETRVAVNSSVEVDALRLYLTLAFGPAALVEVSAGGRTRRLAMVLGPSPTDPTRYDGLATLDDGSEVRLRCAWRAGTALPGEVEARVLRGGALTFVGRLGQGVTIDAGPGLRLRLDEVRYWARFGGSHDALLWLAYLGLALVVTGVSLRLLGRPRASADEETL